MELLGKDAILASEDLPYEDVEVEEWGGTVRIRAMSGADANTFRDEVPDEWKGLPVMVSYLSRSLVDEQGVRLFTTAEDLEALKSKNVRVLNMLFDVAMRLNGDDLKTEDQVKN